MNIDKELQRKIRSGLMPAWGLEEIGRASQRYMHREKDGKRQFAKYKKKDQYSIVLGRHISKTTGKVTVPMREMRIKNTQWIFRDA